MNGNMKLFLELIAKSSGFRAELDGSGRAVHRFTQGARREIDALKRSASSITGTLAGVGVSVGTVQQLAASARLDKSLTQISQTAGEGRGQVVGLRSDFFRMATDTGRQVEDLRDGFNSLIQSGQNWREAKSTIEGINIAMAVTGARADTLAKGLTVASTAFQFDLSKPGKSLELLDKMTVAGRLGNAELENLSDIFARVGVNSESAGMSFDKTLAFIEALSMVERQPERLATLADSTLRVFTNLRYMAEAQKGTGVKFFNEDKSRRDPIAVLEDIRKKYSKLKTDLDKAVFIQKAFGKMDLDTIKGIRTLLQGDALGRIGDFTRQIGQAGGTLKKDLPDAIDNAVDQAGRLKNTLRKAADEFTQPINRTLADLIKWGTDSKANGGLGLTGKEMILGGGALALGTLLTARYGGKAAGALASKLLNKGSSTAIGVAEGKALEAAAGITPVFVTNWPAGGILPAPAGPAAAAGAGAAAAGRSAAWLSAAVPWSLPVAVGAAPFLSKWIGDTSRDNGWGAGPTSRERQVMGIDGGRGAVKNDIKIDIQVDGSGRVFTSTGDLNTSVAASRRGSFFTPPTEGN